MVYVTDAVTSSEATTDLDSNTENNEDVAVARTSTEAIPSKNSSVNSESKIKEHIKGHRNAITPKLAAALDVAKISDRDAVRILIAAAKAFGVNPADFTICRSSICRYRQRFRTERGKELKQHLQFPNANFLVTHWDGKLLPTVTGNAKVDRTAVLATHGQEEQLLRIPFIPKGSGFEQAKAVHSQLSEWGITEKIEALCCGTTSSNTGRIEGACIHLEQQLQKNLLYLQCRHHIYELLLKGVFYEVLRSTSGPETPIFKRFRPTINLKDFDFGVSDPEVMPFLKDDVVHFL